MRPMMYKVVSTAAVVLTLTGCSAVAGAGRCHNVGFALSLARDTGGRPSPLAAVRWFTRHGTVAGSFPGDGWHVVARTPHAATVRSGAFVMEVAQGRDGTWQVDEGHCSRPPPT